jgi:AAA+ superfamily predicted ATPase
MAGEQEYYFVNRDSKHIYKVHKYDEEHVYLERSFKFSPETNQHVEGDGFATRVGHKGFQEKYSPVDPRVIERIRAKIAERDGAGGGKKEDSVHVIYEPTERDDFKNLILDPKIVETIMTGVKKIEMREELEKVWGLGDIRPMQGKVAMNFYGPPGTGKTMAARALARQINKKIMQVDYASMISKWVGDTAKHIRSAFQDAQKADAMLFFDEADSMLSKRVEHTGEAHENSVNQNRNVLMQELDRFNNVVIFATNFFKNYDEALLRRIAQHIKFELPDESARIKILEMKVPKLARDNGKVDEGVDLGKIAKLTDTFSGSDLENIVANSIEYCATNGKKLDQNTLMDEMMKIKKSKHAHGKFKSSHYQSHKIGIGAFANEDDNTEEETAEPAKSEGREM